MTRPICLFLALLISVPANAATLDSSSLTAIVAGIIALACVAVALKFNADARAARAEQEDLKHKIALDKAASHQLRMAHGELERAIAEKDEQLRNSEHECEQARETLAALRGQLSRVARIDAHTGIANRQHFLESLGEEIKRAVRQRKPVTLLLGELDFFDDYVDINGKERADYALQLIASKVSQSFRRAGDLVARVGPKRFAVVLPEADDRTGERFAEKFRRVTYDLCIPFPGSDAADRITMSVGAVTVPPSRLHDRKEVENLANVALEKAQAEGYNRVALSANAA